MHDAHGIEREYVRMLSLIRSLFFDSKDILIDVVFERQQEVAVIKKRQTAQSCADRLANFFCQIMDETFGCKNENLFAECLTTIITFASQNNRFKNFFYMPVDGVRRTTLLKLLCEHLELQNPLKIQRLLYTLLRTLSISNDVVKDIVRLKVIDSIV